MPKNIIIIGSTSFIGINFIKQIIIKDVHVIAVVRPNSAKTYLLPKAENITIVEAGMEEYANLDKMIHKHCDALIYLSWNGTRGADRMNADMQINNYLCSVAAVESSLRLGCKIVVSAGSQAEYGNYNCPIPESTICKPNSEYGKQKLNFFDKVQELCSMHGVHFKEPRFFSLFGPGDFEGTMVISTLRNFIQNKECYFTQCKQKWDFLYIDDAVKGVIKLLETDCADGAYNFGSGNSKELRFFIEEMYKISRSKSALNFGAIPYLETGMVSLEPVVDKLKRETGWYPEISFETGILNILSTLNVNTEN